jgi:hypothetical protein
VLKTFGFADDKDVLQMNLIGANGRGHGIHGRRLCSCYYRENWSKGEEERDETARSAQSAS